MQDIRKGFMGTGPATAIGQQKGFTEAWPDLRLMWRTATTTVGSDGPKETPERTMGPAITEDLSTVRKDGE